MTKLFLFIFLFSINTAYSQEIIQELLENDIKINYLYNRVNTLTNCIQESISNEYHLNMFNFQIHFWTRELNSSRNQSGPNYRQLVTDSLKTVLKQRIQFLEEINSNHDLIISQASHYRYIDPWYLKLFANDYIGKDIVIFGTLSIDQSAIIRGRITGYDLSKTEILVYFIPLSDRLFSIIHDLLINNQNIVSHFRGRVEYTDDEVYFVINQL